MLDSERFISVNCKRMDTSNAIIGGVRDDVWSQYHFVIH